MILKCVLCLLPSWYPGVINVFADKNNFTGIKPENMESFYNSVTTLVSTQVGFGDLGFASFIGIFTFAVKALIHFQSWLYDYIVYDQWLWETTHDVVTIEQLTVECNAK